MKWPWSRETIKELVEEFVGSSLSDAWEILDKRIKKWQDKLAGSFNEVQKLKLEITDLKKLVEILNQLPINFDVESQIEYIVEKTGVKQKCINGARRIAGLKSLRLCVGKDIHVVTLPDDNDSYTRFEVRPNCHYFLLGVKFLSRHAQGIYSIWEGPGIRFLRTFIKAYGKQPSITLKPVELCADYCFTIRREEGKGSLKLALIGYSARPNVLRAESALRDE